MTPPAGLVPSRATVQETKQRCQPTRRGQVAMGYLLGVCLTAMCSSAQALAHGPIVRSRWPVALCTHPAAACRVQPTLMLADRPPSNAGARAPRRAPRGQSSSRAGSGAPAAGRAPRRGRPPRAAGPGAAGRGRRRQDQRVREPEFSVTADTLPSNLSYVPESEMNALFREAALRAGHDEQTAAVLTRCALNMYSLGCGYHPSVMKRIGAVLEPHVGSSERWAVVLWKVIQRELPKLRGNCLPIVPVGAGLGGEADGSAPSPAAVKPDAAEENQANA